MAPAVAMRQADPVQGVTFGEKSVVLGLEEARDPVERSNLHLLNGLVEGLFDSTIQDPGVFESHLQSLMPHQLLKSRFADAIVQQDNGESMAETVRGKVLDVQLTTDFSGSLNSRN